MKITPINIFNNNNRFVDSNTKPIVVKKYQTDTFSFTGFVMKNFSNNNEAIKIITKHLKVYDIQEFMTKIKNEAQDDLLLGFRLRDAVKTIEGIFNRNQLKKLIEFPITTSGEAKTKEFFYADNNRIAKRIIYFNDSDLINTIYHYDFETGNLIKTEKFTKKPAEYKKGYENIHYADTLKDPHTSKSFEITHENDERVISTIESLSEDVNDPFKFIKIEHFPPDNSLLSVLVYQDEHKQNIKRVNMYMNEQATQFERTIYDEKTGNDLMTIAQEKEKIYRLDLFNKTTGNFIGQYFLRKKQFKSLLETD